MTTIQLLMVRDEAEAASKACRAGSLMAREWAAVVCEIDFSIMCQSAREGR